MTKVRCCAAVVVSLLSVATASAQNDGIDSRLLGRWETTINNDRGEWTLIFEPRSSGRYVTRVSGPVQIPDETGVLVTRDNRWSVKKDNSETDGGTYEFHGPDTVTFSGLHPAITWHRLTPSVPAPATPDATAKDPQAEELFQRARPLIAANRWTDALPLLRQAADRGHSMAQHRLGYIFQEGGHGVKKDAPQAALWFGRAAAQGNRASQYALGTMVEEGEGGLAKDDDRAAQLYEASARQGFAQAQFSLGLSYEFHFHDRKQAIYWLELAGKQGRGDARWTAEWLRRPDTPHFRESSELGAYINAKVGAWIRSSGPRTNGSGGMIEEYYKDRAKTLYETGGKEAGDRCRFNGMCY